MLKPGLDLRISLDLRQDDRKCGGYRHWRGRAGKGNHTEARWKPLKQRLGKYFLEPKRYGYEGTIKKTTDTLPFYHTSRA